MTAALIVLVLVALLYLARPTRCPRGEGIHDYRTEHEGKVAICAQCGDMQDLR